MKRSILFVTSSLGLGGAERQLLLIANGLKNKGFDIHFFCFGPTDQIGKILQDNDIIVNSTTTRKSTSLFKTLISLYRLVRSYRPDIIHFFLPKAYLFGAPIAKIAGQKTMIMGRRSLNNYQRKYVIAGWFERLLHKQMKAVVGNSKKVIQQLEQEENVPSDKLHLIYNGIEALPISTQFNRNELRKELGIPAESLVFIIIANLIPYKGHIELIKAFGLIKDKLPEHWDLICVGRDTGIQNQLNVLCHSNGISDHVHFIGQRNDIGDLISCADIGLLTSHEEGFSNAILEIMSFGLPMIVTDVGGNKEAVIDGQNGFVVPPKDPEELSKALLKLLNGKLDLIEIKEINSIRILNNFSIQQCIHKYEKLYLSLV